MPTAMPTLPSPSSPHVDTIAPSPSSPEVDTGAQKGPRACPGPDTSKVGEQGLEESRSMCAEPPTEPVLWLAQSEVGLWRDWRSRGVGMVRYNSPGL